MIERMKTPITYYGSSYDYPQLTMLAKTQNWQQQKIQSKVAAAKAKNLRLSKQKTEVITCNYQKNGDYSNGLFGAD